MYLCIRLNVRNVQAGHELYSLLQGNFSEVCITFTRLYFQQSFSI